MKAKNALSAIALASLGSAAIVAVAIAMASPSQQLITFAFWTALGFVLNALFAGTLGLAWHRFAMKRGWRGLHAYMLPALATGALIPTLVFVVPSLFSGSEAFTYLGVFAMVVGLGVSLAGFTALFAWLLRRPDRDVAPNPPTSPA